MTTPRFPNDFWMRRTPEQELPLHAAAALPPAPRMAALSSFFDGPLFCDAETPMLRELETERRTDPLHSDGTWRVVADWAPGPGGKPQSLFIPEHYEPKYAYPLLVWIAEEGADCDLAEMMPDISTRNFFGLMITLPSEAADRNPDSSTTLEAIKSAVLNIRSRFHIHSERIYLASVDAGAQCALDLVLQKPEWFGGAVVLGGRVPSVKRSLGDFEHLQGKRVLLGSRESNSHSVEALQQTGRLLHSAGIDVETQQLDDVAELTQRTLRLVNRWMMEGIAATL